MPEFADLTEVESRRVREFLDALRTPCEVHLNEESLLVNREFESEFRSKLLAHHCFLGSPLLQSSFDSAFFTACQKAGHQVRMAPEGQRFWDL